jgi:hypothetical protein
MDSVRIILLRDKGYKGMVLFFEEVSVIFFADDSLLFCKANLVEWRRLTKILERYEVVLGQKLNKEKTSIFFSRNTSLEKREEIYRLSGLNATQCYEKYLSLPTMVGRSRYKAFKSIKDSLESTQQLEGQIFVTSWERDSD